MHAALTEDEQVLEAGLKRAAAGGWMLIAFGGLSIVLIVLQLVLFGVVLIGVGVLTALDPNASSSSGPGPVGNAAIFGGVFGVLALLQLVPIILSAVVAFGGYNLLRLRSRSWAFTGAIGAIVGLVITSGFQLCFSSVGILGILLIVPIGIIASVFAFMAINDPRVEAGFRANARLTGMADPD